MPKIFMTGATGFIGSHLAENLAKKFELYALIKPSEKETVKNIEALNNANFIIEDLTNYAKISDIVKRISPNIILHLGARTPVRDSFDEPMDFQAINYLSTINLVHAAKNINEFDKFVFASTMESYGWQTVRKPFTEDLPLNPGSPYAVSKVSSENYIKMAGKAFDLPHIILRPCNTYGGKHDAHVVIEYIIKKMLSEGKVFIGTPNAVRDFIHVNDHVNAYLKIMDFDIDPKETMEEKLNHDINSFVFNFGWGLEKNIGEIANTIKEIIGYKQEINYGFPPDYPNRPVVEEYLSLNANKSRSILEWKPQVPLLEGLKATIKYWENKHVAH